MKALLFVVVLMVSLGANAAQTRVPNERDRTPPSARIANPEQTPAAKTVAIPTVDTIDAGEIIAYSVQHLDPWSILAAGGSYKNCVKETSQETCFKRCECGFNENNRKCGNNIDCRETASLEKEACDAHCLTDY